MKVSFCQPKLAISLLYDISLLLFTGNVAVPIGLRRDGSVEQAQIKG